MKVTKATIFRTVLIILAVVNIALEKFGVDLIPVNEYLIASFIETAIEIAAIGVGFWKNNSFTQNAIKADKFLQDLRNSEGVVIDHE